MIAGKKINLRPANLADRRNVYDWCFQSETTKCHSGPPDYPEITIPTYEEFCEDYYEEYYFTASKPDAGSAFIIESDGAPVGFISYSAFHLKPSTAELDIWMHREADCGKGFGVDALVALGDYLHGSLGIRELIIAPSSKNTRAVNAYEKAGFRKSDKPMVEFLQEEYISLYGGGDYGPDETAILTKRFDGHDDV